MLARASLLPACLLGLVLAGCATRSVDVRPTPANPADFATWSCSRIDDEIDRVQQRAADVAYAVDERAGNNIVALGLGVMVFWPAMLAMRPDGLEAADLARLKGRFEALGVAAREKRCAPASTELSPESKAKLPVALGERLVYEDRTTARRPASEWVLLVTELRRGQIEFALGQDAAGGLWRQDLAGNVTEAPQGQLHWPRLLRAELSLGQILSGEILVSGDPYTRARMRGQVVAVGPQSVAGRRFDAAVIELFGDASHGESYTRVEGAIVVDRISGVLLRLDLRSAQVPFTLQRRLVRVERAAG